MKNQTVRTLFFMVISNFLYALAFPLFYLDNQIAAGGFGGVATALSHVLPLTPGLLTFLMTVPFLIWGGLQRGWMFSFGTLVSSALFSLFEDCLLWLPPLTHNQLLAAIFGGVLYSMGTVFMLKAGISAGGTDLMIQLIRFHFPHLSHGSLLIVSNVACVAIAVLVFRNLEAAFYSVIAIYVSGTFADHLTQGREKVYVSYVITQSDPEPIAREVETELHRGVTLQQGLGMYMRQNQNILMIVVKPAELYRLQNIVNAVDPKAFLVFTLGSGAVGGGFQGPKGRYPVTGPEKKTG